MCERSALDKLRSHASTRTRAFALFLCCVCLATACADSTYPPGEIIALSLVLQPGATPATEILLDVADESFHTTAKTAGAPSTPIRTSRGGAVPVRAYLLSAARDTLASVAFVHDLAPRYNHWIHAYVGRVRLHGKCSGSLLVAPITHTPQDSLFVTHGRLPVGAIC